MAHTLTVASRAVLWACQPAHCICRHTPTLPPVSYVHAGPSPGPDSTSLPDQPNNPKLLSSNILPLTLSACDGSPCGTSPSQVYTCCYVTDENIINNVISKSPPIPLSWVPSSWVSALYCADHHMNPVCYRCPLVTRSLRQTASSPQVSFICHSPQCGQCLAHIGAG